MKQWTEEDLILYYYEELSRNEAQALREALSESKELSRQYQELCQLLGASLKQEVPEPDAGMNRRIMAEVNALHSQQRMTPLETDSGTRAKKLLQWLGLNRHGGFAAAGMALAMLVVVTFYLGRLSVEPVDNNIAEHQTTEQTVGFDDQASRRILLANLSTHMESSQRLLTMVSNGGSNLGDAMQARRQMVSDLIEFNRLYRRIAEQSNDTMLAALLQQMESLLLEINNSDDTSEWNRIQQRLDDTDLLYKLKVTDNRIKQETT